MLNHRVAVTNMCLMLISLLALGGCAPSGPKPTRVEGTVSFAGGKWPAPGMLYFSPIEGVEGFPRVPGTAEFDAEGNFVARTFTPGDGLMPGKYAVHLACWKVVPTMQNPAGVSHLPNKFRNPEASGLQVTVAPDIKVCTVQLQVSIP